MPIRYYEGIEGAGKSVMMGKDLLRHSRAGGLVYTFPGYDVIEDNGKVISQLLMPEDWVNLPPSLRRKRVAIGIDEVTNFFNHHAWYNKMCDMMSGLMAERRKFEVAILMSGPFIDQLPPDIRRFIHEVIHCADFHWLNHDIPRGERTIYWKEDYRGMLSGRPHFHTIRKVFYAKKWWKNIDTYQAVDLIHQFTRVRIKGREIILGADGQVLNGSELGQSDPATLSKYLAEHSENPRAKLENGIRQFIKEIKGKTTRLPRDIVYQYFKAQNKSDKDVIGSILKSLGVVSVDRTKEYDFSRVSM